MNLYKETSAHLLSHWSTILVRDRKKRSTRIISVGGIVCVFVRLEPFYNYIILPSCSTVEALPANKKNPLPTMVRYVLELSKSFHIIVKLKYTNELYTDLLNFYIY